MANLPLQTAEIFDILTSKRSFICDNSTIRELKNLYDIVDEHYELLSDYYSHIDFQLKRGNGFFYFSRNKSKDQDKKLESAYQLLDIVDFFKTFDSSFSAYSTFTVDSIVSKSKTELGLANKLTGLGKQIRKSQGNLADYAESLVKNLNNTYIELEDEDLKRYKVLSSFRYLEELFLSIAEEDHDETS